MVHALLMLPLLGGGKPLQSEVVASVRTATVVYEIQAHTSVVRSGSASDQAEQGAEPVTPPSPPGDTPLLPAIEEQYELLAKRVSDSHILWKTNADLGPGGGYTLFLVGSLVIANYCFDGTYIECETQAFNTRTGQQRWKAYGSLAARNEKYILLRDMFHIEDDEVGSFIHQYRVVKLPEGDIKTFNLRIPPRTKCTGPVELLKELQFSTEELVVKLQDSCGTFVKTIR